ncbi:MAG TPA: hypothetical protein VLX89_13385 [Actinomycetota bacterium]|nr:hypothetical protein [Actinomycetota bacterium]
MRRTTSLAAVIIAIALAACSKGTTTAPPASGDGTSTVQVGTTSLGQTLTNADGRTLYLFAQDSGTTSACDSSCLATWPALTVSGQPTAGTGVNAAMLGTGMSSDGKTQVTYNGHLLYTYVGDSAAGDTNGQGLEGFFAVGSTGSKLTGTAAASPSSTGRYNSGY